MFPRTPARFAVFVLLAVLLICFPTLPASAQESAQADDPPTIEPASQTLPLPLAGVAIAGGFAHTCVITIAGGVKCWGDNDYGQLGNNNAPNDSDTPVNVVGLGSGVAAITAGFGHTCALTTGGGVKCWGYNFSGQLGDDHAPTNSDTPVDVVGLDSVVAITAGSASAHTCALLASRIVKCWGANSDGQLGDGNAPTGSDTPVDVVGMDIDTSAIAAGDAHTCAVTAAGGAKCWGDNAYGQAGDGNAPTDPINPVDVVGLGSGVAAIAGGFAHTCALTTGGDGKCWGNNTNGQLGNGNAPTNSLIPVGVVGLGSGVAAVASGRFHACTLSTGGGVKCWGYNFYGQLGNGDAPNYRDTPIDVVGLTSGVTAIAAGANHTCAVTTGGVFCWGDNSSGQLGDGTQIDRSLPGLVLAPTTCYRLTRNKTGSGAAPAADPANTPGCPANHYLPGQIVTLLADSVAGSRVNGWAGTANNGALSEVNYLKMPAADSTVSVAYAACHALTRSHSGAGSDPVASPGRSDNCPENTYVSGEKVTLIAKPNPDQRVEAWTGADTNPFTGALVNSLTMPNAARTVSAAYETCFALAAVVAGQGEPLTANPASSTGCAASAYVAGESITLAAAAAAGWSIQGWSGTANNASTGNTNAVTMPAANHTVGVTYAEDDEPAETGGLTGVVYEDANANDQPDSGEGVEGVTVTLESKAGVMAAGLLADFTDVTDAAGVYRFAGVPEGDYRLGFDMPEGYAPLAAIEVTITAGETAEIPERKAQEQGGPGVYLPSLLR